jgi:carboxypeptidase T
MRAQRERAAVRFDVGTPLSSPEIDGVQRASAVPATVPTPLDRLATPRGRSRGRDTTSLLRRGAGSRLPGRPAESRSSANLLAQSSRRCNINFFVMSPSALPSSYAVAERLCLAWSRLAARTGGSEGRAGQSCEGRPIPLFHWGQAQDPAIFLTGLMHGIEVIGGMALFETVRMLLQDRRDAWEGRRLVVMPLVNPDGLARNLARLRRGARAWQRCNARGVDLNRNFPHAGGLASRLPMAGSRRRWSPYYMGEAPLSEPESRAVAAVAEACRPSLALGFHSFGELLLYPWGCSRRPHPQTARYRHLAAAFTRAQGDRPYACRSSAHLYPTLGDLDDWLDEALGTDAFTVEVGMPAWRAMLSGELLQPFRWMNPDNPQPAVSRAAAGACAMIAASVELGPRRAVVERYEIQDDRGLRVAAR